MIFEVPERYNASSLLDENLAGGRGAKVAVRTETDELTYAELHDRVCRAGRALGALGVEREQRVLMAMDDTPAWPTVFLGAIRIGAVPVPVSYLDTAGNFLHFVRDSGARLILVEAPALGTMQEAMAELDPAPQIVVANGDGQGGESLDALLAAHPGELDPADTHRDDFAFWLFSAGSTGLPKGVVHLQHDIAYTTATFAREILHIAEDDVCFST
ncbi:MAG: AMP-binding protein, partial [Solirubrobacterales bacterium]|nr:AMP-binding protein [Solirubrobacterales bacterium]